MTASAVGAVVIYALLWIGWVQGWAWLATLDSWMLDGFRSVAHQPDRWTSLRASGGRDDVL